MEHYNNYVVSRASRIFPTCTHARMTIPRPLVIRACVYVGKIRLARETNNYAVPTDDHH